MPEKKIKNWTELEQQLFMRTVKRVPLTIVRGKGARVWDDKGKKYLDFVGGWAVNSLGHCHPVQVKALTEQAKTLIQASNQFYTVPQLQLAEVLLSIAAVTGCSFATVASRLMRRR